MKPETNTLPSKPDVKESELMKESATEMKKEIGEKHNKTGKPTAALKSSVRDDEKSKELKMDVSEQENELGSKLMLQMKTKTRTLGNKRLS